MVHNRTDFRAKMSSLTCLTVCFTRVDEQSPSAGFVCSQRTNSAGNDGPGTEQMVLFFSDSCAMLWLDQMDGRACFFLLFPTCDVHVMSCRRGEYPDIGYPPFSCVNTHLRASVRLVYTLGCKDQRNEKETEDMLTRDGKQYYKAQEAAKLAGVNARTLSRWIAAGQLAHFLFPFRESPGGPLYYRLEPPDETDTLWEGENVYRLPPPGKE